MNDTVRENARKLLTASPAPVASRQHAAQTYSEAKPLKSMSAGCEPEKVNEMREFLKHRGVRGVEVTPEGRVHFTSRAGRKDYNKATGTFDGDAGYGDHAGS